jgi:alkylhydroperoxidase family enzyme
MWDEATGHLKDLWQAATAGPGALAADDRLAIAEGRKAPVELAGYVATVRASAYKVTDEDVARLQQAGLSDEQIFEATVAAAVGAGFDRLKAMERIMGGES